MDCITLNDFLSNIISNGIGAFLGILGAICIYINQKKNQEKKEKIEILNNHKSNLIYLNTLLKNSIMNFRKQISLIENQIESIKLNKYAYHSPVFVILDDIRRIQNLESKELFNSYKHFFNTPNDLINYKNIFSIVDFLEEQRKSLLEMQNNCQVTITNYKKQLKPYLEDIIVEVLLFLDKIQGSEAQNELQLSLFFKSILTKLNELKDEDNLRAKDDLNNNFEKYLNILEEVIKISIEKYKAFYKREEILKLSRKAIITIYDINNESTNALNHFENFAQECNHYLEKLDNRITDLKSFAEN